MWRMQCILKAKKEKEVIQFPTNNQKTTPLLLGHTLLSCHIKLQITLLTVSALHSQNSKLLHKNQRIGMIFNSNFCHEMP